MLVKIRIHPPCKVLYYKNFSNSLNYLNNGNVFPILTPPSAETRLYIQKELFTKNCLAHYFSYATLVTYVHVLGTVFFQFLCKKELFKKKLPCPLSFICHLGGLCTCFGDRIFLVSVQDNILQILLRGRA